MSTEACARPISRSELRRGNTRFVAVYTPLYRPQATAPPAVSAPFRITGRAHRSKRGTMNKMEDAAMQSRIVSLAATFLCLLTVAGFSSAAAQGTGQTGTISGSVIDDQGAAVS